jgi:predicted nuclease of restriction endonuclease-like (RecB) superfamily
MARKRQSSGPNLDASSAATDVYDKVVAGVVELLEIARRSAARAVNSFMTATYWEIGRRIVEFEQGGRAQAVYGAELVRLLAADLTSRFGRGFGKSNLYQMRSFFLTYPEIFQTPSGKLDRKEREGITGDIHEKETSVLALLADRFPLPWSHYVQLLKVDQAEARQFYEAEALRSGWTVRQLERQITTLFYERTLASRNKAAMLRSGAAPKTDEVSTPEEEIKDPLVLEFLGLKDEYSESDLEEALVRQLEEFLLELGGDFAFIGRQRRLRIGDEWYRVDLLFYHRRLRCLVIFDLKLGKFTHADAGQMHLYLNYAREHWTHPDENPPVGVILCTQKDKAVAHYALGGLPNKLLATEYRTTLPDEKSLANELARARRILEARGSLRKRGDDA